MVEGVEFGNNQAKGRQRSELTFWSLVRAVVSPEVFRGKDRRFVFVLET